MSNIINLTGMFYAMREKRRIESELECAKTDLDELEILGVLGMTYPNLYTPQVGMIPWRGMYWERFDWTVVAKVVDGFDFIDEQVSEMERIVEQEEGTQAQAFRSDKPEDIDWSVIGQHIEGQIAMLLPVAYAETLETTPICKRVCEVLGGQWWQENSQW